MLRYLYFLGVETGGAPTTEADPNASENTFARDRGGPTPGNAGPHATSIANKLDPNVDSDQDGKPKAGPNDFETTTGQENESSYTGANTSSNTTGPSGLTGEDGSSTTAGNTTGAGTTGTSDEYSSTNTKDNADVSTNDSSADRYTGQDDTTTSSTSGGENATGGQPRPLHDTEGTGVTSGQTNDPKFSDEKQSSANDSSVADRGQDKAPVGGVGAVEPSVEADPSSGQKPMQKQQGSGRPMEEPSGEQTDAIKDKKDAAEDTQAGGEGDAEGNQGAGSGNVKKDPDDHSGEPLGAVPHGGSSEEEKTPHPGQEGGKKSEGTGEQWVKTSGLAADGGDFDATKPGAGREADRKS